MKKTERKDVFPFIVIAHVYNSFSPSVVSCRSAVTIFGYFCFVAEDKLYVVMELIEGAPLGEHFNSLKEKGTRFSEERIWHIFIQVCSVIHEEIGSCDSRDSHSQKPASLSYKRVSPI